LRDFATYSFAADRTVNCRAISVVALVLRSRVLP
jgi:hypothetical protein